jgi:hypothetical protein
VSTEKTRNAPQADLLARLAQGLEAGARAEDALAELGVPRARRPHFWSQAQQLLERARARLPPAAATETRLALGVLVVLSRAPRAAQDGS